MNTIYVFYKPYYIPDGIGIIIENIRKSLKKHDIDVLTINSLDNIEKDSFIIPCGILASISLTKKGYSCKIALLVDAISLGVYSKFTSCVFKKHSPIRYKLKLFIQSIYFLLMETIVLFKYQSIILVSEYDKTYFSRFFCQKIIDKIKIIPNGVTLPKVEINSDKIANDTLRLGFIANWSYATFYDNQSFIETYWEKLKQQFPSVNIKLIFAGRNISKWMSDYWDTKKDIYCMGEVNNVDEFYQSIDCALITIESKCGILNKVLEAFAYKKVVLGLPQNFYALPLLTDAYFEYHDQNTLFKSINTILNNPVEVNNKIDKAHNYIQQYHSWDKNYIAFEELIIAYLQ
jgi:glycosyltransferase involved in cell wall biosynthesis